MTARKVVILNEFFRGFRNGSTPLLLLDYDGTLAPFRVDRFQAVPWPGVREVLQQIQSQQRTRMVIVSGRPAAEIAPLLAMPAPVEVWGLHAFERLHPDGRSEREHLPEHVAHKLAEAHAALERDSFGGLFEKKPNAAVMHWRGASAGDAAQIERRARALFEPLARVQGFKLLPFESGLELRAGRDKSAAVNVLLRECRGCGPAAYLGDDLTDEAAFRALKGRGLSLLVRPQWRQTEAEVWLTPPEELLQFLESWRQAAGRS